MALLFPKGQTDLQNLLLVVSMGNEIQQMDVLGNNWEAKLAWVTSQERLFPAHTSEIKKQSVMWGIPGRENCPGKGPEVLGGRRGWVQVQE